MNPLLQKIKIQPQATLLQTLRVIDDGGLGMCFVVDAKDKFVGVVSDGDIRRGLLKGISLDSPLSLIPRKPSVVGRTSMSEKERSALLSNRIRILPVLDDDGYCVNLELLNITPFIPVSSPQLDQTELRYVSDCVLSGWISSNGFYVKEFERLFSEYCHAKFGVACSNGTAALHLVLEAMGVGPGDEVIVPSMTFIATANAVRYTGATPIFADCDAESWCIDPQDIARKITARTKAIIPVHLYGHPADMDAIMALVQGTSIKVVEDAAEAHGAHYKGKRVGCLGHAGIFSFFGNKIITTGEGGMIVTNDADLDAQIRLRRDHGMDPKNRFHHIVLGFNYRMTNLQAAVGCGQMEKIDNIIRHKRQLAHWYQQELASVAGIQFQTELAWATNVYWLVGILLDATQTGYSVQDLQAQLLKENVDSRPFFPPVHQQAIYHSPETLPVTEKLYATGLCLPSSMGLTYQDVARICRIIRSFTK